MRSRDDRAAANQRATDPLYQARLRAVAECDRELEPSIPAHDRVLPQRRQIILANDWERLSVEYLRAEWPPSMLN
jgi:hypothetical protein